MITLVTPVGTSLFTNYLDKNPNSHNFSSNYDTIKNCPAIEWPTYQTEIDDLRTDILTSIQNFEVKASAELQSIANIQIELDDAITVYLLASDTIASRLAAEILKEQSAVLGDKVTVEFNDEDDVIKGLQVEDPEAFSQEGMTKLIQRINSISGGFVGSHTLAITGNFAINITGGYKATLPYLTILAQLERVPLYYNFEDTDTLIQIPQAPLVIDWALIERYSDVLEQIDEGIENWQAFQEKNFQAVQDLAAFIEVAEEIAFLSPIGQIFWNYYQRYFVADLPSGSYFSYERQERQLIDQAFKELYKKLYDALRGGYFDLQCLCENNPQECKNCYCRIRNLGHDHDLNHGGQIQRRDIFIFKSTDNDQIRLLYTFKVKGYPIEVNGQGSDVGEITRLPIFDVHCGAFDHNTYIDEWQREFGGQDLPEIDFFPHIFEIPTETLTRVLETRNLKIR